MVKVDLEGIFPKRGAKLKIRFLAVAFLPFSVSKSCIISSNKICGQAPRWSKDNSVAPRMLILQLSQVLGRFWS